MNRRLLLVLAPAALALTTFAYAQPPGPAPGGGPGGGPVIRMMHGGPGGPEMKAMHEAMMKQHLEDLKTVLRLRPDQESALQAFMAAHHPPGMGEMHAMPGAPGAPDAKPQTTPDRLAEMAKHEAAMAAEHEKMRAALAKFYAALSPEQQKVFDALQRLQGPHMGGPGMMMMGGHMGGGGMRRIEIRREGPGQAGEHDHH